MTSTQRRRWHHRVTRGLLALLGVIGAVLTTLAPPACAAPAPRGFVYQVTSPAGVSTLYLYGTVHVGRSNGPGLDAATTALVANCQHIALELDPRNRDATQAALKRYALYLPPDHLAAHIPADLDRRAMQQAELVQLPQKDAEQIRPWMLANFLATFSLRSSGFDTRTGSESLLAGAADAAHANVLEIEGADQQMKLIGGAPEDVQIDALSKTVGQIEGGHIADEAGTLLTAWEHSDTKAIDRLLKELTEEPGPYPKFMADQVLAARNGFMVDAVAKQIALPGDTLFAVGVLHLLGPNGMVAELRRRGYTVTALSAK